MLIMTLDNISIFWFLCPSQAESPSDRNKFVSTDDLIPGNLWVDSGRLERLLIIDGVSPDMGAGTRGNDSCRRLHQQTIAARCTGCLLAASPRDMPKSNRVILCSGVDGLHGGIEDMGRRKQKSANSTTTNRKSLDHRCTPAI